MRPQKRIALGMYDKEFTKQDILNIFHFIDWIMKLPPELEEQFSVELETYEKEHKMPYVTSIERRGIEKGKQQGMQQGRTEAECQTLLMILNKRFGTVPQPIEKQIRAADSAQLETWINASLDAKTLAEIFPEA